MKILFIRHAVAEDRSSTGDDLARELTVEGRKKAEKAFKGLAGIYDTPDVIVSSQAARARQTAKLLANAFQCNMIHETEILNPGCRLAEFRTIVRKYISGTKMLAVVGHEPDISRIVGAIAGEGKLRLEVKKASCIEMEVNTLCKGELQAVIPPRMAAAL